MQLNVTCILGNENGGENTGNPVSPGKQKAKQGGLKGVCLSIFWMEYQIQSRSKEGSKGGMQAASK